MRAPVHLYIHTILLVKVPALTRPLTAALAADAELLSTASAVCSPVFSASCANNTSPSMRAHAFVHAHACVRMSVLTCLRRRVEGRKDVPRQPYSRSGGCSQGSTRSLPVHMSVCACMCLQVCWGVPSHIHTHLHALVPRVAGAFHPMRSLQSVPQACNPSCACVRAQVHVCASAPVRIRVHVRSQAHLFVRVRT